MSSAANGPPRLLFPRPSGGRYADVSLRVGGAGESVGLVAGLVDDPEVERVVAGLGGDENQGEPDRAIGLALGALDGSERGSLISAAGKMEHEPDLRDVAVGVMKSDRPAQGRR